MDWDYAVWAWQNLKTGKEFDDEWEKNDAAYVAWKDRYEHDPAKAIQELKTHSDRDLIKHGQSLELAYQFYIDRLKTLSDSSWKAFEPNCYEGELLIDGSVDNGGWKRLNIFTGECDWPDWRSAKSKAYMEKRKTEYLGTVAIRQKRRSSTK